MKVSYRSWTGALAFLALSGCNEPQSAPGGTNRVGPARPVKQAVIDTVDIRDSVYKAELAAGLYTYFKYLVVYNSLAGSDAEKARKKCGCEHAPPGDSFYTSPEFKEIDLTANLVSSLEQQKKTIIKNAVAGNHLTLEPVHISYWTDTLFSIFDAVHPLTRFKTKRERNDFDRFRDTMRARLNTAYPSLKLQAGEAAQRVLLSQPVMPVEAHPVLTFEPAGNPNKFFSTPLGFFLVSACLCINLAYGIFLFFLRRKLRTQENRIASLETRVSARVKKSDIDQQVSEALRRVYRESEKKVSTVSEPTNFSPAGTGDSPEPVQVEKTAAPRRLLYFANPASNGSFLHSSGRIVIDEGGSIYEFELSENGQTATFRVLDSLQAAKIATGTAERALLPVCKYETSMPDRVTRILTSAPGKATLENDRWVVAVQHKALIRFE